ncbi:MAG: hypothetical protein ACLSDQ_09070 [Adlercreutzia equolifaciens]
MPNLDLNAMIAERHFTGEQWEALLLRSAATGQRCREGAPALHRAHGALAERNFPAS